MRIFDRNSSFKYEGTSNEARRLRYERKLREEEKLAEEALQCDVDLPGQYCRSTDEGDDDLAGAAAITMICIASAAVWVIVGGAMMVVGGAWTGWIVSLTGIVVCVVAVTKLNQIPPADKP